MITRERLMEVLDYNQETGVFTWVKPTGYRAKAGDVAGAVGTIGYRHIKIEGKHYYAHRLAWFYVNGAWPSKQIDHIDGSRLNNAIANLREATNAQNNWNKRKQVNNKSGFKGVSWSSTAGKWWAQINREGRHYNLGYYDCPAEAAKAYQSAAERIHGDYAHAGSAS